ncbi:MAG: SGNH/GDSL hydrolase family protein [Candidatus Saccharimonadales bacterium]
MNANPKAITILCYGDSNTYGQKPDRDGRYAADVRWTGVLQKLLGEDFYVIEEGLGSRTTDLEYDKKPGRNGKTYLEPCLDSHNPLDVVVVMLGTNDLKIDFHRSPEEVGKAIKGLVELTQAKSKNLAGSTSKIILVSPILVDDTAPRFTEFYTGYYDHEAAVKSQQLSDVIKAVADELNCNFIDAASVAKPGVDGLHMNEESNAPFAELLAKEIGELV